MTFFLTRTAFRMPATARRWLVTAKPALSTFASSSSSSANSSNDSRFLVAAAATAAMAGCVWQQNEQKAECCGIAGIVALKGVEARYVRLRGCPERSREREMRRTHDIALPLFFFFFSYFCFILFSQLSLLFLSVRLPFTNFPLQ